MVTDDVRLLEVVSDIATHMARFPFYNKWFYEYRVVQDWVEITILYYSIDAGKRFRVDFTVPLEATHDDVKNIIEDVSTAVQDTSAADTTIHLG